MLAEIGWLALGLLLLALGADSALKGAAGFALQVGMRPLRVGVAALLLGAALPELAFGIRAAEAGAPELAYSVLLGRCLVNLGLVLGLLQILVGMPPPGRATRLAAGSVALGALLLWWLSRNGVMSRIEGILSLAVFGVVLGLALLRAPRVPPALQRELETHAATRSEHWRSALRLALGIVALAYGAGYLFESAPQLAGSSGLGGTLAALVLSVPLLGSAWFAGFRGLGGIALGLVLGSSLFNLLFLAGLLAATEVVSVPDGALRLELPALVATSALALAVLSTERLAARAKGAVLLLAYLIVLGTLVWHASA